MPSKGPPKKARSTRKRRPKLLLPMQTKARAKATTKQLSRNAMAQSKTKQSLLAPVSEEQARRYKKREAEIEQMVRDQKEYGLMGRPLVTLQQQELYSGLSGLSYGRPRSEPDKGSNCSTKPHPGHLRTPPVSRLQQSKICFGVSVPQKGPEKCSESSMETGTRHCFVIHLCPSKNDKKARCEGKPFQDFLNMHPLWIQNFRANKSQQTRNKQTEYKARVHLCTQLMQEFYDRHDCTSLLIVGQQGQRHTFQKSCGTFKQQMNSIIQSAPRLRDQLYERVRLHSREYNKVAAKKPSTFSLGIGMWTSQHTFIKGPSSKLTHIERKSLRQFTKPGGQFGYFRLTEDAQRFGHMAMKESPQVSNRVLDPDKRRWAREGLQSKRTLFDIVSKIENQVAKKGLISLRSRWEDVFTRQCELSPATPCAKCRGCRQRFAQALFVVVAAAGVSDENILPRLGAVFRSEYYQHYSIEEWAVTDIGEFVFIYRPCSKQVQNALYSKMLFDYLANRPLPTTLNELTCLRGIQKKSACLLLQAALRLSPGVAVDRHLMTAGKALGWIPEECKDPTEASLFLEEFLPPSKYTSVNNVAAGLYQEATKSNRQREIVLETAQEMGEKYDSTILTMLAKIESNITKSPSPSRKRKYKTS